MLRLWHSCSPQLLTEATMKTQGCRTPLACIAQALLIFLLLSSATFGQNSQTLLFSAGAYGTYAYVGHTVTLAKTAPVGVGPGCGTPEVGASQTGTVASVNGAP